MIGLNYSVYVQLGSYMCVHVNICVHGCMCVPVHLHVCGLHACLCVCVYTHVCVFVCIRKGMKGIKGNSGRERALKCKLGSNQKRPVPNTLKPR